MTKLGGMKDVVASLSMLNRYMQRLLHKIHLETRNKEPSQASVKV